MAMDYYDTAFSKKMVPDNIPTLIIDLDKDTVIDIIPQLIDMGYVKSKSEFLRLVKQGGVSINGERINEDDIKQVLYNMDVIKIGKKHFARINK